MGNPNSIDPQQKFDPSTMPGRPGQQQGNMMQGHPAFGYPGFQPTNPTMPMMENQGGFDANSMVSQRPEGYGTQLSELAGRSIPTPMEKSAQSYGPTLQPQQKKKGGK